MNLFHLFLTIHLILQSRRLSMMEPSSYDAHPPSAPHSGPVLFYLHQYLNIHVTPDVFLPELSVEPVLPGTCLLCSKADWFAAIGQSEDKSERSRLSRTDWERCWLYLSLWSPQKCSSSFNAVELLQYCSQKSTALFQKVHYPFTPIRFKLALALATKEFWLNNTCLNIYCIDI